MSKKNLLYSITIFSVIVPFTVSADTLPLEVGAYLQDTNQCAAYFKNDLDFIDFEVEQEGRSFGFIEQGCFVHSIVKIRDSRYLVDADCIEAGEAFDRQVMLDIFKDKSIRIDGGEMHHFCSSNQQKQLILAIDKSKETPKAKLTRRFKAQLAISKWAKADNRCRGGFDTAENTKKACEERDHYYRIIREQDWCFGKEEQSSSKYQWHDCEQGSIM